MTRWNQFGGGLVGGVSFASRASCASLASRASHASRTSRTSRASLASLTLACSLAACVACVARADGLDDVLALVPPDVASMVVVPSIAKISSDIEACIASMDRKETAIAGRPVDQLRSMLGIREGFDEKGSMAGWSTAAKDGDTRPFVLLVPCEDPAAFVKTNITPGADGAGSFRGERVYARTLAKHVIVSSSKSAVDGYDAAGGIAASLAQKVGERGMLLAHGGDLIAWAGATALAESQSAAAERAQESDQMPKGTMDRFAEPIAKIRALFTGVRDGLVVVDADALGLSIRAYAVYAPQSELTKLASGAKPVDGSSAATLSALPKNPFYLAAAIDAQALGGAGKFDALTAAFGVSDLMPAWLTQAQEGVRSIRFACYPSKLGVIVGGVLNDCACVIETDQPHAIRDLFKSSLMAQAGNAEGVKREPSWEDGRVLKSGESVDAFELKETPLGASEADGADLSGVAMRQLTRQAIFGSRGMHGFVKVLPTTVIITFSQRPDVFGRAMAAVAGGESLKDESVIVAMRPWLVPGAQIEAFVSVGQILKVARQMAEAFGAGEISIPKIPARSAPIALALRSDAQSLEAAVMIPTAVLAAGYDQMMSSFLQGRSGGQAGKPTPGAAESATDGKPDGSTSESPSKD